MGRRKNKDSGIRYDEGTRRRARKLARQGKSVPEIAAALNGGRGPAPSQKTIRTWLESEGLEANPGRQRQYDRGKILRDLNATTAKGKPKFTRAEICARYGCSPKFVSDLATGKISP